MSDGQVKRKEKRKEKGIGKERKGERRINSFLFAHVVKAWKKKKKKSGVRDTNKKRKKGPLSKQASYQASKQLAELIPKRRKNRQEQIHLRM